MRLQILALTLIIAVRLSPASVIGRPFPTVVDAYGHVILPQRLHQVREITRLARQVYAARRSRLRSPVDRKVIAAKRLRVGVRRESKAVVAP